MTQFKLLCLAVAAILVSAPAMAAPPSAPAQDGPIWLVPVADEHPAAPVEVPPAAAVEVPPVAAAADCSHEHDAAKKAECEATHAAPVAPPIESAPHEVPAGH